MTARPKRAPLGHARLAGRRRARRLERHRRAQRPGWRPPARGLAGLSPAPRTSRPVALLEACVVACQPADRAAPPLAARGARRGDRGHAPCSRSAEARRLGSASCSPWPATPSSPRSRAAWLCAPSSAAEVALGGARRGRPCRLRCRCLRSAHPAARCPGLSATASRRVVPTSRRRQSRPDKRPSSRPSAPVRRCARSAWRSPGSCTTWSPTALR